MSSSKITLLCYTLYLSSLFIITCYSRELCHPNEKRALLEIRKAFPPNPYGSWQNNTDCCQDWDGVECDTTTNHVTYVSFLGGDIHGKIAAAIGDLPYLISLRFRKHPNLTGPIPKSITKLQRLVLLDLSWNNLSGPIPSFLNQLNSLKFLDLSFNNFTGSIPPSISKMPKLTALSLDRNKLTGSIPESFGYFKQKYFALQLSHNQLSGSIPRTLERVTFNSIDLSRNRLTGDASFLMRKGLDSLTHVDLSRNLLEFDLSKIEFKSSMGDLNVIDLNHNKIYGNLPPSLAKLPFLLLLNVSYNRLCGPIPTGGTLSEFDKYSFFNNRCLCGAPLAPCN